MAYNQEDANRETALNRAKQSKANREAESAAAQNNARVTGEQESHNKKAGRFGAGKGFESSAAAEASATGKMINTGGTKDLNKGMQTDAQQTPLTRKQELENKYDKEIFHKNPSGDNHVTGGMSYVYGYAGSNPMKEGQDEGEYMQGMKDNWVGRQLAGDKYDKEIFHKDPGGDQSKHVTKDMSHAYAYIAKSPMQKGQDEGEYLAGMRSDWVNQQMDAGKGYQQGINAKNAWKKEGKQSKGKEFLDNKVDEQKPSESAPPQTPPSQTAPPQSPPVTQDPPSQTAPPESAPPQTPPSQTAPPQAEPTTTIPSYRSRHDQTPPPQAAPPKGGMNTGATTDLSGVDNPKKDDSQPNYQVPETPSYSIPETINRDYIKYNKGNQSGLSDDEARYAMLTGSGQSSYSDDDDDAARRYEMLTGKSDPGQTQLDRYTSRYTR